MKTITTSALSALLLDLKGASFVRVVTATEPKMNQKHRVTKVANPFMGKRVLRTASRHGMLGASYENVVQNRRDAEDHPMAFRAEALWNGAGEHVEGSKVVVRHRTTGKQYLVFYPHRESSVMQDAWTVDGTEVAVRELSPYLPPAPQGSGRQEVENPVAWRTIALDNILSLQMNGETYTVEG
jgi:hypothetical protein